MKYFIIILVFFLMLFARAQDTLVYKNASKSIVMLKEISQTEVKYYKIEMPDGPMYIVSKNDIEKIIYKNGVAEMLSLNSKSVNDTLPLKPKILYKQTIIYDDIKYGPITPQELSSTHYDNNRRPVLQEIAGSIKQMKNIKNGTAGGAVICGALAGVGGLLYGAFTVLSGDENNALILPPAILAGITIGFIATSVTFSIKLNSKQKQFVKIYND